MHNRPWNWGGILTATWAALALAVGAAGAEGTFQGIWTHAGPHSAVVYWRLADRADEATSYVEFGPTRTFGKKTPATTKPRWAHLHRLTGLEPGQVVHYRPVLVRKGKAIPGPAGTLTPPRATGYVSVPGTLTGPPYVLGKPGKYLLTRDLAAPGTAIDIAAGGVELEMDGHTIRFGTARGKQSAGIQIGAQGPVAVHNGVIVQGDKSADYSAGIESRWRAFPREISAMSVTVHRPNGYPVKFLGAASGAKVHHNELASRVTEIESRHYPGNDLLRLDVGAAGATPCEVHDNLLTGGCHRGISVSGAAAGTKVFDNDIAHHARYVNGYALSLHAPGIEVRGNRITSVGRGMHLTRADLDVHDNYLDLVGHATLDDMPAKSRPFQTIRVELHGIKLEGARVTRAKVYRNWVRIRQLLPAGGVDCVPATPLNVACYAPDAMNEIHDNDVIALTYYRTARLGGYGDSGQWASAIHLVGMTHGPASAGRYSAHIHDNRFVTNHLYVSASSPVTQTVRIEKNRFVLSKNPPPVPAKGRLWRLGPLERAVQRGGNTFP